MAHLVSPSSKTVLAVFLLSQISTKRSASYAHTTSVDILDPFLSDDAGETLMPRTGFSDSLEGAPAGRGFGSGEGGSGGDAGKERQGLPLAVVLHAAAQMALSAARGIVMMPLPGVNEMHEVESLRVSACFFQICPQGMKKPLCFCGDVIRQRTPKTWLLPQPTRNRATPRS